MSSKAQKGHGGRRNHEPSPPTLRAVNSCEFAVARRGADRRAVLRGRGPVPSHRWQRERSRAPVVYAAGRHPSQHQHNTAIMRTTGPVPISTAVSHHKRHSSRGTPTTTPGQQPGMAAQPGHRDTNIWSKETRQQVTCESRTRHEAATLQPTHTTYTRLVTLMERPSAPTAAIVPLSPAHPR